MDIYHQDPRLVRNDRKPVIPAQFKASFDVDGLVMDRKSQVVMEFVLTNPFLTFFRNLINFPAGSDVFVHQAADVSVFDVAQSSLNPSVRLFRQFKLDVVGDGPVAKRVPVSRKAIWVSQAGSFSKPLYRVVDRSGQLVGAEPRGPIGVTSCSATG
jgi:hypothetical protein